MKTTILLILFILAITSISCEDIIDVNVPLAPSRLVVEASLDWEKGTTGNEQTIVLSNSTSYFKTQVLTEVTGASVKVTNDTNGREFIFTDQANGTYTTLEFEPAIGQSYSLEVIYVGEVYAATERMNEVPEITDIYQSVEDGFDDEALEVHVVFQDAPETDDNVLFKAQKQGALLPLLEVGTDEFVNGNTFDWWIEIVEDDDTEIKEAFASGDVVEIKMYAISEAYKNYMEILIEQLGDLGLFSTIPVALKGNCINLTNPDNFAHGYFRLTEFNKVTYTFD